MHVWFRSYFMTQEADPQGRRVFPVASHHLVVLGQTLPCLITGRGKQSDARVGPCGAVILSLIPWPAGSNLYKDDSDGDPIAPEVVSGKGLVTTSEATTPHELRSAGF